MRQLEFNNRICYEREVLRKQKIHRMRIQQMKTTAKSNARAQFDNTSPQTFSHLKNNVKKKQLEKEKFEHIDDMNKLLVKRMSSIMLSKASPKSMEFVPGVRIGTSQNPVVDCYLSDETHSSRGCAYSKPSLNAESRRREHRRIEEENAKIYERLNKQKPRYNVAEWLNDRKKKEKMMKYMARDGTVGYLLPKTHSSKNLHANGSDVIRDSSIDSSTLDTTSMESKPGEEQPVETSKKDKFKRISKLAPLKKLAGNTYRENHNVTLLEATSVKGVQYTVIEKQVQSINSSCSIDYGFRGLYIQATVGQKDGSLEVSLNDINRIAAMCPVSLKTEVLKIQPTPNVHYSPCLSKVLNAAQLINFLLTLVQCIRVEVLSHYKIGLRLQKRIEESVTKVHEDHVNNAVRRYSSDAGSRLWSVYRKEIFFASKIQGVFRGKLQRLREKRPSALVKKYRS